MEQYTVTSPTTLKDFTDAVSARASLHFRTLLKAREIRVNGKKVSGDLPLLPGDEVRYYLTAAQAAIPIAEIVYEDDAVLVADKESGVSSEALLCDLQKTREVYAVHRLDRNTEGLSVFAKTPSALEELLACFREHRVEKCYLAVVVGTMSETHAVKTAFLEKDEKRSRVFVNEQGRGECIVTEWTVLERREGTTLLLVTLHTGKTHQIRAHLAYLGHPVLGDEKYGDPRANRAYHARRQRLLAKQLTLFPEGSLAYLSGKTFLSARTL